MKLDVSIKNQLQEDYTDDQLSMKYLTPKKPISKIARDRAEEMEERNVDLYEAIAGLFEELAALEQSNAELKARVEMLEKGGKQK